MFEKDLTLLPVSPPYQKFEFAIFHYGLKKLIKYKKMVASSDMIAISSFVIIRLVSEVMIGIHTHGHYDNKIFLIVRK
jgi:hypothetical protein